MFHSNIDPSQWSGNMWVIVGIIVVAVVVAKVVLDWLLD